MDEINDNSAIVNNNLETDKTQDYISAINEIKNNSVSKEQYNKLREENKRLLDAYVNGETIEAKAEKVKPDESTLRNNFLNNPSPNGLEYFKNMMDLRDSIIERTGQDPMAGDNEAVSLARSEEIANIYKECIEIANGNSAVFHNELTRRIKN